MLRKIKEKIDELKESVEENDLRMLYEAKMFELGWQSYNENFLNELKAEFPKLVRFYVMGNERRIVSNKS